MNTRQLRKLPKIDSHNHLVDNRLQTRPTTSPFLEQSFSRYTADELKRDAAQHNVRKAIIFPLPSENYSTKRSNRVVLEASKTKEGLFPVAFLHSKASPRELFRYARQGFVGFKIYSDVTPQVAQALSKVGKPVTIHPPFPPSSKKFREMIQRLGDKTPIILAHLGRAYNQRELEALLETIARRPNISVDTSAFTAHTRTIEIIIRTLGPKRVLFGSDFPFGNLEGFQMVINKSQVSSKHKDLVGRRFLVSEKPYGWNSPELIQLSKRLKLPQLAVHRKSTGQLYKVLMKLFRRGVISRADIEDIFYHNAARLFKI